MKCFDNFWILIIYVEIYGFHLHARFYSIRIQPSKLPNYFNIQGYEQTKIFTPGLF